MKADFLYCCSFIYLVLYEISVFLSKQKNMFTLCLFGQVINLDISDYFLLLLHFADDACAHNMIMRAINGKYIGLFCLRKCYF